MTAARVGTCRDKVGHQIDAQLSDTKSEKATHTDGRCTSPGRPGQPEKRSLCEDRKTCLGQSTSNSKGQVRWKLIKVKSLAERRP